MLNMIYWKTFAFWQVTDFRSSLGNPSKNIDDQGKIFYNYSMYIKA